jgi:hypothetical protein
MADGAEVACCMMPCGIVHDNEPEGKRDGTLHTRLDGSQGSDKCGPCACSPTTTLYPHCRPCDERHPRSGRSGDGWLTHPLAL